MKNKNRSSKFTDSPFTWMIVSLFISLFIWMFFESKENVNITQTFTYVEVEMAGEEKLLENHMVIINQSAVTVDIQITGPRRLVNKLKSENLKAVVDVSNLTAKDYTKGYDISYPDDNNDYKSLTYKTFPKDISFTISEVSEITVPVTANYESSVAIGYSIDSIVFEPSEITVTGPDYYLKNIDHAMLSLDQSNRNDPIMRDLSESLPFVLVDKNENEVSLPLMDNNENKKDSITCSAESVDVELSVVRRKEVPLTYDINYTPGVSSENTTVKIEPQSVILTCPSTDGDALAALEELDSIFLESIETDKIVTLNKDGNFEEIFTRPIAIPEGLTNNLGPKNARITVTISGLVTREFVVTQLLVLNVPKGYEAEIITESILVTLRGTDEDLNAVTAKMIRAEADLNSVFNGKTPIVSPKITVEGYEDQVGAIQTEQVSIVLNVLEKEGEGKA